MTLTNKKQRLLTVATLLAAVFLTIGCSNRIADLTLVSTKNIDLSSAKFDVNKGQRAKGEDCVISLLGLIPLGIPNLENAVDKALQNGNGNIMVDQVTSRSEVYFIIAARSCIDVEGTVLNTGTTGGTTNKPIVKQPVSYNTNTPVMNQAVEQVPAPIYQNMQIAQPQAIVQPVTQTAVEDNEQTYRQPQAHTSGKDLRGCLALVDNTLIAKCVRASK
jgi:hypothetical protein